MVPTTFDDAVPPAPAAHGSSVATAPYSSSPAQFFSATVPPLHSDSASEVHVNPLWALVPQLPTSSSPGERRAGGLATLSVTGVAFTAPVLHNVVSRNELRRLHTDMQHTNHVPHASETASRSASARPFRARRPPSSHEQPSSQPPASARLPSGLRTRPVPRRHVNACTSADATSDVPLPSPYTLALPASSLLIRDPPPPSPLVAEAARLLASTASAVPPRTLPIALCLPHAHAPCLSLLPRTAPPPQTQLSLDSLAATLLASGRGAVHTALSLPVAVASPLLATPHPMPPEAATYAHLVARAASQFRLGHQVEGRATAAQASALALALPEVVRSVPPALPPPSGGRIYPAGQHTLNSLPDRAAPYRRGSGRRSQQPPPPDPGRLCHPYSPFSTDWLRSPLEPPLPPVHLSASMRRVFMHKRHAAVKLAPILGLHQLAKIFGSPPEVLATQPPQTTYSDLINMLCTWSAGYLSQALSVRTRLTAFMRQRQPNYVLGQHVYGHDVTAFLAHCDSAARTKQSANIARRVARGDPVPDCPAAGSTAETGVHRGLRFLALTLHDAIDVTCIAVSRRKKKGGRRRGKPAASLSMRVVCNMEWHAAHTPNMFDRAFAGAVAGAAHFDLRFINAQRARLASCSLGVQRGVCELDAKMSESEQNPRPMWASANGFLSSPAHWDAMRVSLADVPQEAHFFRGTDGKGGDTSLATRWLQPDEDGFVMSRQTYILNMVRLATSGAYAVPLSIARTYGTHSAKHVLPNIARARCEPEPAINELGKWSGSIAQAASASAAFAPEHHALAHGDSMGTTYSAEAADEVVPRIVERQVQAVRSLLARLGGPGQLPYEGGWGLLEPASREAAESAYDAILAAARTMHGAL
jgi:hypothetical protein